MASEDAADATHRATAGGVERMQSRVHASVIAETVVDDGPDPASSPGAKDLSACVSPATLIAATWSQAALHASASGAVVGATGISIRTERTPSAGSSDFRGCVS